MCNHKHTSFVVTILLAICGAACSNGEAQKDKNTATQSSANSSNVAATPIATPGKTFTAADVAKLKWIEGSWRGMDGEKPFYERYKLEPTALVVESLNEDGTADGAPERFELKNGEFGKGEGDKRSAASEITDTYVQFVPVATGKGNSFRFVNTPPAGWDAILEWPASGDKPARRKIYKMEAWTFEKKAM